MKPISAAQHAALATVRHLTRPRPQQRPAAHRPDSSQWGLF
ncbi:MAG: hypothetical protein QM572_05465 [Nocardioides sp.]